jgi:hypothetical protein
MIYEDSKKWRGGREETAWLHGGGEDVDLFGDKSPMKGECKQSVVCDGRGEAVFEVRQGVVVLQYHATNKDNVQPIPPIPATKGAPGEVQLQRMLTCSGSR